MCFSTIFPQKQKSFLEQCYKRLDTHTHTHTSNTYSYKNSQNCSTVKATIMIMNLWHFFHLSEPNTRLSGFTRGHSLYLFTNWGKTLGGVLGPEVEDVEFSLQGSGHQLVHVDVFPVKLHTANLLMTSEKIPLFVRDIYHRLQLHGDHVQMDFMNTGSFTHTHWERRL